MSTKKLWILDDAFPGKKLNVYEVAWEKKKLWICKPYLFRVLKDDPRVFTCGHDAVAALVAWSQKQIKEIEKNLAAAKDLVDSIPWEDED